MIDKLKACFDKQYDVQFGADLDGASQHRPSGNTRPAPTALVFLRTLFTSPKRVPTVSLFHPGSEGFVTVW